jgi:GxxExxY protein
VENTNRHELKNMKERNILYKELSYKIVGAFYEVYNTLGPGYKEIVYHKALAIEFGLRGLKFEEKKKLEISYKGHKVGIYEPDFVIENKIIVEIKAVPEILKVYEKQLYYYLIGTNYQLGYLVNFGAEKLDIRRRIYT